MRRPDQPNRRVRDPYARWCDRENPRGSTYVDRERHQSPVTNHQSQITNLSSDAVLADGREELLGFDGLADATGGSEFPGAFVRAVVGGHDHRGNRGEG